MWAHEYCLCTMFMSIFCNNKEHIIGKESHCIIGMKRSLHKQVCILIASIVAFIVIVIFFEGKPMIEAENSPEISFISLTLKENGRISIFDMPGSEVSDELADNLISLFLNVRIRNRLFPPPQSYNIVDGSRHVSIKIRLENAKTLSMFVNLCNDPRYNSAQFGNTHYTIINHQQLYEDVFHLLSEIYS